MVLKFKRYKLDARNRFIAYLYIFPLVSRWLFPESLEIKLSVNIFGIFVFLPELCYVLIPFIRGFVKFNNLSRKLLVLLLIIIGTILIGMFFNDYRGYRSTAFLGGIDFILAIFLLILFPLNKRQIAYIKIPFLLTFILLGLELILFGLKLATYKLSLDSGGEHAGILRVHTTIAGATGTAVVIYLLGALLFFMYYRHKLLSLIIFLLLGIFLVFTMTRSTLLAYLSLSIVIIIYNMYNTNNKLKYLVCIIIGIGFLVHVINKYDLLASINHRNMELVKMGRSVDNGRFERWEVAVNAFKSNPVIGVGLSNIFPTRRLAIEGFARTNPGAPHNYYLLLLAETGLINFMFFGILFIIILYSIKNKLILFILLFMFGIIFNTEACVIDQPYCFLITLLMNIGMIKLNERKN